MIILQDARDLSFLRSISKGDLFIGLAATFTCLCGCSCFRGVPAQLLRVPRTPAQSQPVRQQRSPKNAPCHHDEIPQSTTTAFLDRVQDKLLVSSLFISTTKNKSTIARSVRASALCAGVYPALAARLKAHCRTGAGGQASGETVRFLLPLIFFQNDHQAFHQALQSRRNISLLWFSSHPATS